MRLDRKSFVCCRCGRHRASAFLQPIGDKVGLYCPPCRKEIINCRIEGKREHSQEAVTLAWGGVPEYAGEEEMADHCEDCGQHGPVITKGPFAGSYQDVDYCADCSKDLCAQCIASGKCEESKDGHHHITEEGEES